MKLIKYATPTLAMLMLGTASFHAAAELDNGDVLGFGAGSKVSIEASPGFWLDVPIKAATGLSVGAAQPDKNIDAPFTLFGQASQHVSRTAVALISANSNNAQLDFSSWALAWKDSVIHLGSGEGVASVKCEKKCKQGETYTLDYSATLPAEAESLGGLNYRLHLAGTISKASKK